MHYHQNATLQREIATELLWHFPIDLNTKVLDLGCGSGFIAETLDSKTLNGYDIMQTDKSPKMVSFASQFSPSMIADFDNTLPFKNNTFDVTFSSMALQWARNLTFTISEIKRVTKKFAFIAIPIDGSLAGVSNIFRSHGVEPPIITFPSIFDLQNTCDSIEIVSFKTHDSPIKTLKDMNKMELKNSNYRGRISHKFAKNLLTEIHDEWKIAFCSIMCT